VVGDFPSFLPRDAEIKLSWLPTAKTGQTGYAIEIAFDWVGRDGAVVSAQRPLDRRFKKVRSGNLPVSLNCHYCKKKLPTGIDVATCPFCFKSLLVAPAAESPQPFGRSLTEKDLEVHLGGPEPGTHNTLAVESEGPHTVSAGDTSNGPIGEGVGTVELNDSVRNPQGASAAEAGHQAVAGEDANRNMGTESGESENSDGRNIAKYDTDNEPGNAAVTLVNSGDSGPPEHARWKAAAGSSSNPRHTIKADQAGSAIDSLDLPVNLRSVEFRATPVNRNADYQLMKIVGEGAMDFVHKAKQPSIDRFVAFKTIQKERAERSPESRCKFLREAQITGSLDHSNIVPIHDLGISDDDSLFYSMKLVDGTSWEDVFNGNTRDENLGILLKVCDAVGFANAHEVIHRDLKPENVMLGQFGEVLMMAWGMAINLQRDRGRGFSLIGMLAVAAIIVGMLMLFFDPLGGGGES